MSDSTQLENETQPKISPPRENKNYLAKSNKINESMSSSLMTTEMHSWLEERDSGKRYSEKKKYNDGLPEMIVEATEQTSDKTKSASSSFQL